MKVEKEERKEKAEVASNRCDACCVLVMDAAVNWIVGSRSTMVIRLLVEKSMRY